MRDVLIYAICVMGNHVHVLLRGFPERRPLKIGQIVGRHKSFTDKQIKRHLALDDRVWAFNFYDRYVRDGTFQTVLWYILCNPAKAGLVRHWRQWTGTYVDERCLGMV